MNQTVYTRQLAVARFGERRVRRELEARRWQQVGKAVITHNAPLGYGEKLCVGLVVVKHGRAAVDRLSMLALVSDFEPPAQPQIALAVGTHAPVVDGVTYSWVREFSSKTTAVSWMPALKAAHSLLRAVGDLRTEREVRALVARALQRKAVTAEGVREALGPAPRWRHSALVGEVLADFEGGIQSLPEKDFDFILRKHHLPEPTRQRKVQGGDGRYYLDADWERYGFSAEVHGWQHWEFAHREADNWRTANVVADGRRVLVFSSWAVRREQDRVAGVLIRSFRTGGWRQ